MTTKRCSKSHALNAQRRIGMFALAFVLALALSQVHEKSTQAAPAAGTLQQVFCADTYEPNEPLNGAWEIATGPLAFVESYICPPQNGFGDEDWFKF